MSARRSRSRRGPLQLDGYLRPAWLFCLARIDPNDQQHGGNGMGMIDAWVGLWHRRCRQRLQGLAELLAMESRPAVWSQLLSRAGQLNSDPEAAGYIRVRASELVREQTAWAACRCGWLSPRRQQLVQELALTMLVSHFTGRMIPAPASPAAMPLQRAA